MCKLKITLTADAPVKELVELLVKAVKGGTLTAFIDEGPIRFRVSGAGFRFDTPEGIDVPEKENGERKSICVKVILVPRAFSLPRPPRVGKRPWERGCVKVKCIYDTNAAHTANAVQNSVPDVQAWI